MVAAVKTIRPEDRLGRQKIEPAERMNGSSQSMAPTAKSAASVRDEPNFHGNIESRCFLDELHAARKFTFPGDTLKLLRNGLDPVLLFTALVRQQALDPVLE